MHVGTARLVDDGRTERVVLVAEDGQPLGHRARAEVGAAGDDDAGRLAAGMGVDHRDALHWCSGRRAWSSRDQVNQVVAVFDKTILPEPRLLFDLTTDCPPTLRNFRAAVAALLIDEWPAPATLHARDGIA